MKIDDLLQADILLAPRSWHEVFLLRRNETPILNFKLITKEDLIKGFFFDYTDEAVLHLMTHHEVSFELAKTYLENLYFLPENPSNDSQIRMLQKIKTELEAHGLLKHDDLFLPLLKNKRIAVFGYDDDDQELTGVLKKVSSNFSFGKFEPSETNQTLAVHQFETVEDELQWVFNQISLLLSSGVSIDDISIFDPPSEYTFLLKKMSAFYGIPVNLPGNLSLASSKPGIDFLAAILQGTSPEDALKAYPEDGLDPVERQLVDVVSRLLPLNLFSEKHHDFFLNKLRETPLIEAPFDHAVSILKGNFFPERRHIFLLGFNEGNFPKVHKNVDFLDDSKKRDLGRIDSEYENIREERTMHQLLDGTHFVQVSFKNQSLTDAFRPSALISKLKMKIDASPISSIEYGREWAKIRLAEYLDGERKYQNKSPLQNSLSQQIEIPFRKYSHRFSGVHAVQSDSMGRYSYTSISEFFECQFKYYLSRILNIDPFEDTFYTKFGKLAHAVLERKYSDCFDFDRVFEEELVSQEFSSKEKIFLTRLKTEIFNVIQFNQEHESAMTDPEVLTEKKVEILLEPQIKLVGVIDKIVLTGKTTRFLSLIDYKTGTVDFNPNHIRFGYSLQLPMYALLASRDSYLANHEVIGLYIQTIITKKLIRPSGKDAQKFYADQFRLSGLFTDDFEKLQTFDGTFRDSKFIKSLKVTLGGNLAVFSQKRAFSKEVLDGYIETTIQKIKEADTAIKNNDFRINPKSIDNGELPCRYCTYRDICFRDDEDIVSINTKESNDGEMDA